MSEIFFLFLTLTKEPLLYSSGDYRVTEKPSNKRIVDKELLNYVKRFEALWDRKIKFKVVLGKIENTYAGYCQIYTNKKKLVIINEALFYDYSDLQKEVLVFHEMGHCALYRHHNDKLKSFKGFSELYPASIMHYRLFNDKQIKVYKKYKNYYYKELFSE